MRAAAAACFLLAACATVGATAPPPERVAGCWIDRDNAGATTMRWLPDRGRPGVLAGAKLVYRPTGAPIASRYALEQSEEGWSMCQLEGGVATRCWQVAEGQGGSLEGGRVFIDAYGDRLRITVIGDGPDRVIFNGRRDGCD